MEVLRRLEQEGNIDVWRKSPEQFDIMVAPHLIPQIHSLMKAAALPFSVSPVDIAMAIEEEASRLANRSPNFEYEDFNDLATIYKELDRLAAKCLPGFQCFVDSIGSSIEKRSIKRLKIVKLGAKRKAVWMDATTHAREWLTTATLMKIARHLLDNYHKDTDIRHLMDTYDWHMLPVINPDGYVHSWNPQYRLWRKNMRKDNNICVGVDLNRNAEYAWNTGGSSSNSCSQVYHGKSPASEPETVATQNALKAIASDVIEYISLHSYGNYWLIPFGNKDTVTKRCKIAKDEAELKMVANAAANAIEKVDNTKWKRGPSCQVIYAASGEVLDYTKALLGIKYGSVPEVRGTNFVTAPREIDFSFREIWAGTVASLKAIEQKADL